MSDSNDTPKIIVDDDWKAQAQAEKARLAAESKAKTTDRPASNQASAAGPAEAQGADGADDRQPRLPEASFQTIVSTMATQALFAMGAAPDPRTGQRHLDLEMARFQIDCLKVLMDKTEGNLSDEEKATLNGTLYELRSHFIAVTRQVTSQGLAGGGQM